MKGVDKEKHLVALLNEMATTTTIESSEDNTCARLVIDLYESGSSRYDFGSVEEAEEFRAYFIEWLTEKANGVKHITTEEGVK